MRLITIAVVATVSLASSAHADTTFSAAGALPADIANTINAYRAALGVLNPNIPGSQGTGRREINWDGVPDSFSSPNALPGNFFNVNSPRGVVFSTPGTGFQVSADMTNPTNTAVRFGHINAAYTAQFQTFSAERLFAPIGSTVTDITFFLPGSNTPATTRAFGAVFADIDVGSPTSLQLFLADNSLAVTFFPSAFDNGLSFAGILRDQPDIARVRIITGNTPLDTAGGSDYVVMDDFIYGEPVPAPVAATPLLLAAAALRRRRPR